MFAMLKGKIRAIKLIFKCNVLIITNNHDEYQSYVINLKLN